MVNLGIKANGQWASQYYPIGKQLPVSVIVDNLELARSLGAVHRWESIDGMKDEGWGEWHRGLGAINYARKLWEAHKGYKRIYIINEPSAPPELMRVMCQFVADTAKEVVRLGAEEVLMFNCPPASISNELVAQGVYDPLIEAASADRRIVIGLHDYNDFHLVRFRNDDEDYGQYRNRDYLANWSQIIRPETSWHLYHYTRLIERARALSKPCRFAITELGWDAIPDSNEHVKAQIEALWSIYPSSPVQVVENGRSVLRGFNSLHQYWADVFPNQNWLDVADRQLRHYLSLLDKFYPEVEWATIYAFGYGGHHAQDLWNSPLVDRVIAINKDKPVIGTPMMIRSAGNYNVNVRVAPINGAIIGTIGQSGTSITFYETANGWHKILWNGKVAYVSAPHTVLSPAYQPNWEYVTANYRYDTKDVGQVATHNQIQGLLLTLPK